MLDKDGNVVHSCRRTACFSHITYNTVPANVTRIVVVQPRANVPYPSHVIERWAREITECGFPITCEPIAADAEEVRFVIELKDYAFKMHLNNTLILVRACFEGNGAIYQIADEYFKLIEKDSVADRFQLLQDAHKSPEVKYVSHNHVVTHKDNGHNVSRELFFKRIAKGKGVYDKDAYVAMSAMWRGEA